MNQDVTAVDPTGQPIRRYLETGLYRVTVEADGAEFDWDSLFLVLNEFGNVNQRTGPWDFNLLDKNRPLLPAYWVYLNDRKIGLWYFNRLSAQDVEQKHFKGELSFWIEAAGENELRFEPYQDFSIRWESVRLENEPEDTLLAETDLLALAAGCLTKRIGNTQWRQLAERLQDLDFRYRDLLRTSLLWAKTAERGTMPLPLLIASYRALGDTDALARAKVLILKALDLPAWGNIREDGYGHNGDMGAASVMLELALAVNWLGDDLEPELIQRLLERLKLQGDLFIELALLHRGYWGGSILQDHGFTGIINFASAAYSLVGRVPRAQVWLRFLLPRIPRALNCLPTDGVLPPTSYHVLHMHVDKLVLFRELHLQAGGEDIYKHPSLRAIVGYMAQCLAPEIGHFLHPISRADLTRFAGGHAYFDQMALAFGDRRAAWLSRQYLRHARTEGFIHGNQEYATYLGTLWASLFGDGASSQTEVEPADEALPAFVWYRDSGVVIFRDDEQGYFFSTRCGAPGSETSYNIVTNPCDRIVLAPMSGNFALLKNDKRMIQTADGGYRQESRLGNIVLVDGLGQLGDHGPPISCPNIPYGGERIENATYDAETGSGYICMQLAPAYASELGLTSYRREWFFEPQSGPRMVDTISSKQPHRFAWLFHTYRSHSITHPTNEGCVITNGDETLNLRLKSTSTPLSSRVQDTITVWAYVNENDNQACHHLELETEEPVTDVRVEFALQ